MLQLYREKYFNFNVQHFHEKLCELHGIELSYSVLSLSASALLSAAAPDAKQELDAGLKAAESYDWPSAAPHLRYAQLHLALADQRDRTVAHILFLRSTTGNR